MGKEFTPKQLEVINVKSGYNMVLAGPGCGKTDILAERVAVAYENGLATLEDMLCLTFTNRAARGMFKRIRERLGYDAADLFVGNIHRYCSHFLFENNIVSAESSVMDEDDTNEVLNSEVSEDDIKDLIGYYEERTSYGVLVSLDWEIINNVLGIDIHPSGSSGKVQIPTAKKVISAARYKVMDMQHLMYQVKGEHPMEDWYHKEIIETIGFKDYYPFIRDFKDACIRAKYDGALYSHQNPIDKLLSLAAKFEAYKITNGLLDFDDLLIMTYDSYYNDVEHKYHKHYKWIQIDEIQDLSNFQLSLVDLITDKSQDFVVLYLGDEQQAIYSFMGASLESLNMLKSRCLNHIYRLDKNFRSPKYLLDLYNEYAIKELLVDKDFLPEPRDNEEAGFLDICLHDYSSLNEEVERVYNAIIPFLRNEEHKDERTALLVPWNIDANEISDRLKLDGIQHFKISGLDSFQMVHMKTLMAHFNAVDNDFNLIAWSRILKQTYAVESYSKGRHYVEEMRNLAMCPSDLLRSDGITYLREFAETFDSQEIVLFDTETTGVDVFNDDIVQIAAIKIYNGQVVPGSQFNIFLHTDKEIPEKLGKKVNPMVEAYKHATKLNRYEGLKMFMDYIGSDVLMGHNVNYDYNILQYNLKRYCGTIYAGFAATILDTLKLAHLVCPRMRKYKLEYLIERLELEGTNSHMADDDIMATFELAKYCRRESDKHLMPQYEFLIRNDVRKIVEELYNGYKECYDHTKSILYKLLNEGCRYAIVDEMKIASDSLAKICEFNLVDSFDAILSYMEMDVISKDEPNALKAHFQNHLMDMSTYREADLCASENFKEKLFVSTVHKAKGLEFENVIVMRSVEGRYPHFAHKTYDKQEEDKRLFYVAISRAMKRLIVSGSSSAAFTPYIRTILHRFTLRFSISQRYFLEIGMNDVKLYESKVLIRHYQNINKIYNKLGLRDQFDMKQKICWLGSSIDLPDKMDNLFNNI